MNIIINTAIAIVGVVVFEVLRIIVTRAIWPIIKTIKELLIIRFLGRVMHLAFSLHTWAFNNVVKANQRLQQPK
jgi:hypothetical protein